MSILFTRAIRPLVRMFKIDIVRYETHPRKEVIHYPPDFSERSREICDLVKDYTLTSLERINSTIDAVKYVVSQKIGGAFVECGVWRGGSIMAMALTLIDLGDTARDIYLYDTFSGMNAPTDDDISIYGIPARDVFEKTRTSEDTSDWCRTSQTDVRNNVLKTGYPEGRFFFVEGKVENTIPNILPKEIALLRLDTDWYESTKHTLFHLFPLLSKNGVIIIDDYGHWTGAKKAVDEYVYENNIPIFLHRIDYTGRIAIKIH